MLSFSQTPSLFLNSHFKTLWGALKLKKRSVWLNRQLQKDCVSSNLFSELVITAVDVM
jgi:hypothetical protein